MLLLLGKDMAHALSMRKETDTLLGPENIYKIYIDTCILTWQENTAELCEPLTLM